MSQAKKSKTSAAKKLNDLAFKGWIQDGEGQKWIDPFERQREFLVRAGAPSAIVDAAVYVNDTLEDGIRRSARCSRA